MFLRLIAILCCIAECSPAAASELKIGTFDALRVFNEYDHTKELNVKSTTAMFQMGPASAQIETSRYSQLKASIDALSNQLERSSKGQDTSRLENELKIAKLELTVEELRMTLSSKQTIDTSINDAQVMRGTLINEIWKEARILAKEQGYALLIPQQAPPNFSCVVSGGSFPDVTNDLIAQLNRKFRQANGKK
jgi:hypothetical protein